MCYYKINLNQIGIMKKWFVSAIIVALSSVGCTSTPVRVVEHTEYVQPVWYMDCIDVDSEMNGWKFWSTTEYYYSCGSATSGFQSAAKIKALQIAKRNLADRINGNISSNTSIQMNDSGSAQNLESTSSSAVSITNTITDTMLRHYAQTDHYTYIKDSVYHSFVRIKLSRAQVEETIASSSGAL